MDKHDQETTYIYSKSRSCFSMLHCPFRPKWLIIVFSHLPHILPKLASLKQLHQTPAGVIAGSLKWQIADPNVTYTKLEFPRICIDFRESYSDNSYTYQGLHGNCVKSMPLCVSVFQRN